MPKQRLRNLNANARAVPGRWNRQLEITFTGGSFAEVAGHNAWVPVWVLKVLEFQCVSCSAGAAYALKLQDLQNPNRDPRIVACYFGEGAASDSRPQCVGPGLGFEGLGVSVRKLLRRLGEFAWLMGPR
jgi:hypothetical protein